MREATDAARKGINIRDKEAAMSVTDPQTKDAGDSDPAETEAAGGGEDESSTEKDGDDRHLHDDQKAPTLGGQ